MKWKMKNRMQLHLKVAFFSMLSACMLPAALSASEHAALQSDKTVSGIVSNDNGETLIGVNIMVKGTASGTITGIDGDYSIRVPAEGSTLIFSYVGHITQEVQVAGRTKIDVVLIEETNMLEEYVVIGYGVQKKINLTGSVSAVDASSISNRANTSLSTSLSGLSTGLSVSQGSGNPGSEDVKFAIRGIGSFNGSEPMVLIDGAQASMKDISPDDVESISILKDGASAAIYGARAANGVILITSKKGKLNEAPRITYSNLFASQKPVTDLKLMSDMPSWMEWHNVAQRNNDVNASVWYSDYLIDTWKAANSNPYGVDNGFGIPNWMAYPNTDWSKEMFKPSFFHRHNLAISGGSKNSSYALSLGYQDNPGTMKNTGQERFNFRINAETKIANILTVGTQTYATKTKKQPGNASMPFLLQAYPGMIPMYDGVYGAGEDPNNYERPNILRNVAIAGGKNESTTINTTWYTKADIWNGISGEVRFNYQEARNESEGHTKNIPLYSFRQGLDQPVYVGNSLETAVLSRGYSKNSSYVLNFLLHYNKRIKNHSITGLAGYEQTYYEISGFRGQREGMVDWGIIDLPTTAGDTDKFYANPQRGDYAMLSYFGRVNYDYAGRYLFEANLRADATSKYADGHRWGYFPSFSAGWRISDEAFYEPLKSVVDDMKIRASWGKLGNVIGGSNYYPWQALYGATNGVLDGEISNGLAQVQPANPYLTWESVSTFNVGTDVYLLNSRLHVSADYYERHTSNILDNPEMPLSMGKVPNRQSLNTAKLVNKGVELSVGWNAKVKDFKYGAVANVSYNTNKVTKFRGALNYGPIDGQYDVWGRPVYGYNNLGDVSTFSGDTRRVEGHQMNEYFMNVAYQGSGSYYLKDGAVNPQGGPKDGMIRTKSDLEWVGAMIDAGYDFGAKVGKPRLNNGTVVGGAGSDLWYGDQLLADLNGDGIYGDSNDKKFIGKSSVPKWNLGLMLNAEWKGFDINMAWEARLGSYAYLNSKGVNGNISLPYDAIPSDVAAAFYTYDAYKSVYDYDNYDPATDPNANVNGKYPRLLAANSKTPSNILYLQNTSFLKLRTLQIGYTLPSRWVKAAALSGVRIFAAGENLLTIKHKDFRGVDPELGGNVSVYPLSRMFSGGVNITF